MALGILGWVLLALIGASLERALLRREPGGFLASLLFAWCGAALGSIVSAMLGWSDLTGRGPRPVAAAIVGMVLILGGLWVVRSIRMRTPATSSTRTHNGS